MLNILRFKLKNRYKNISVNEKSISFRHKEFVPAVRHWKNSIYVYNKNTLSLLPEASKLTIKLIKGYLNLFSLKINKNLKKHSTNKLFVSQGEFKHTNDLVNITIYFYNKQSLNYKRIIKYILKRKRVEKYVVFILNTYLRKYKIYKKNKNLLQWFIINGIMINKSNFRINLIKLHYQYNSKLLWAEIEEIINLYIYYIQLIYINKYKFNKFYLQGFINLIRKIYKKKIEFNFINIKYFYLNSNIFTQLIVFKLKNNRRKLRRYLLSLLKKTKTFKQVKSISNKSVNSFFKYNPLNNLDITNNLLYDTYKQNTHKSNYLKKIIFNEIKYKNLSGVRFQLKGRLTRRYTASRSLKKIKLKGSLKNINSSLKGYPSSLLIGKLKSNLDYTNLNSKTRIGSFGVKGWVSGK